MVSGIIIGLLIVITGTLGVIGGTMSRHHEEKMQLLKDNEYARQQQAENHFTEMMAMLHDINCNQ